jgi:hypothetical protein
MCYSDFFSVKLHERTAAESFDDLVARIERAPLTVSIQNITPKHWTTFYLLLTGQDSAQAPLLIPVIAHVLCYQLAPAFCQTLRQYEHVQLLDRVAAWAPSVQRDITNINAFDLAGFVLEVQQLCVYAQTGHEDVYVLMSTDTDWQPNNTQG